MLGRLFGRNKEDNDETVCSSCGRTLLAGEWTQRLVDDDGRERYVCALCSRPAESADDLGTPAPDVATVSNGRVKPARADSDVFWRAIKDKDVEIERLESLLARAEAEKQELAAQLAALRRRADDVGAETVEIPPDELERELAASDDPPVATPAADGLAVAEPQPELDLAASGAPPAFEAPAAERTDPGLGETMRAAQSGAVPVVEGFEQSGGDASRSAEQAAPADVAGPSDDDRFVLVPPGGAASEAPAADDELVPLTILQRGVDLLNVSAVPRRIVETNESLGMPQVHVASRTESSLLVTFIWTMGWYQFCVDLADGGHITLADRGYEERHDLRPNATVRPDGTVHLAPTQIKPPTPRDDSDAKPPGVTSGVIISKSLMGQRTDDENVPADWKTQRAPDFDWGH